VGLCWPSGPLYRRGMRPDPHPLRWSTLILLLGLGCGDSVVGEGDDEAGDATTAGESGDASDNAEAGSEGNTTTQGESESGSGSESESESESGEGSEGEGPEGEGPEGESSDGSETVEDGSDSTETGEPLPDCVELDEATCDATDICIPYWGTPYEVTGDGTICLGEPQFLGCMLADRGCARAVGTLCMGDQAYQVPKLCPNPPGFEWCDPPVDWAMSCMP
jgi:hypothetical protein